MPVAAGAQLNRASIAARLDQGHLDATTLMEHLIQRGVPQRSAHHAVGALVNEALTTGGSADWVVTFSVQVGIGSLAIVYFGSEAQKEKYLPRIASTEYIGACEKGFASSVQEGQYIGAPVQGLKVILVDGAAHAVDSSEVAFKIAGARALRAATAAAKLGHALDHCLRAC